MKKYTLVAVVIILIVIGVIGAKNKSTPDTPPQEWNTFSDQVHGWEIKYPPTVTEVALADDLGEKNWVNNLTFYDNKDWVLSLYTTQTKSLDPKSYLEGLENSDIQTKGNVVINDKNFTVGLNPNAPKQQIFLTIQNGMIFIFNTNDGVPVEKILESFETF